MVPARPYGKDKVVRGSEGFIEHALHGGSGPSNGIHDKKIGRPNQSINTAVPADNVKLAMPIETSILDEGGWAGGIDNLKHSLTGASSVDGTLGAAGKVHTTIIADH